MASGSVDEVDMMQAAEEKEYPEPVSSRAGSTTGSELGDSGTDCSRGRIVGSSASTGLTCGGGSAANILGVPEGDGVKVLCVGVMRTGLKTLHEALHMVGHANIYDQEEIVSKYNLWSDALENGLNQHLLASIFEGSEVVMGIPTFCIWEEILKLHPHAKVILTIREEDLWWESVKRARALMDSELPGAPLRYGSLMRSIERVLVPSYHQFCEVLRFAWATTLGGHALQGQDLNEQISRGSYRRHNSYVCTKLDGSVLPTGEQQLLVYDVREGWGPLCAFLGKDIPESDFPSVLNVPYFPGYRKGQAPGEQEFGEILLPDSNFGLLMRHELRKSLAAIIGAVTVLVAVLLTVHLTEVVHVPLALIGLTYSALVAIVWTAYVVMHDLVMRVPALVVLPMAMKSLLIAGALHACFISYGILKEMLVTQDRVASPLLVLSSRFMSIVCGAAFLLISERRISFGAPLYAMGAFAFTNEASTWAGYEMLKYVSFPVQVMAKSVKMLPNMIMGRAVNGTQYSAYQYVQAVGALVCVAIMHFSDEQGHDSGKGGKARSGKHAAEEAMDPGYKLAMGVAMLCLFFAADSFTSQWQTAIYKKHPKVTQTQMMLGGNLLGFILTSSTLVASWSKISASLWIAVEDPAIMGRIVALG
eukprot:CAMPEP_0170624872 /NCGR_PEP_ID=MMETSP0224-20130122/30462_1 /TAXON_ID=285029 /ORGANISM="Togula jolla, Strain CCCM 725" /LENGTH=645 /DNA_ID=CAMNT_0010951419 /DNA_START=3 /DNA_END=1936 /DNA_ORIENTATION=-